MVWKWRMPLLPSSARSGFNPSTTNRWSGSGWRRGEGRARVWVSIHLPPTGGLEGTWRATSCSTPHLFQSIYHQPVVWKYLGGKLGQNGYQVSIHLPPTGGLEVGVVEPDRLRCRCFNPSTTNRWSGSHKVPVSAGGHQEVSIHLPPTGGLEDS